MKFLTVPRLQRLSSLLQHVDLGDQVIHARVEAYSCKAAGDDKRLGKQLQRQISSELAHSPVMSPTMSPLGPLTDANTRKLLISLITTMNASFPDYDFSNLRAEQFERELSPAQAMNSLNVATQHHTLSTHHLPPLHYRLSHPNLGLSSASTRPPSSFVCYCAVQTLFLDSLELSQPGLRSEFWQAINETIELSACELYTFNPHPDSELDEGKLWSVRLFAYHRKEKKVVFIAASAVSKLHDDQEEDEEDVDVILSSSGGEGGPYWDEADDESQLLWDELEFGDGAARMQAEYPRVDEQGREMLPPGMVREVTDTASSPLSGVRRRAKGKRATHAVSGVGKGAGDEEEKRKRRKRRTTTPKAAGEERKGKRAVREGRKEGDGDGQSKRLAAPPGSDDEERGGGRSLLDARRVPSPALGILPLAALVEAKDTAAAEAQRPQQAADQKA